MRAAWRISSEASSSPQRMFSAMVLEKARVLHDDADGAAEGFEGILAHVAAAEAHVALDGSQRGTRLRATSCRAGGAHHGEVLAVADVEGDAVEHGRPRRRGSGRPTSRNAIEPSGGGVWTPPPRMEGAVSNTSVMRRAETMAREKCITWKLIMISDIITCVA